MPLTLNTRDPNFEAAFTALLAAKRESAADVDSVVTAIIDDVAARGDPALVDYTRQFDRLELTAAGLRLTPGEIAAASPLAPCPVRELSGTMRADEDDTDPSRSPAHCTIIPMTAASRPEFP